MQTIILFNNFAASTFYLILCIYIDFVIGQSMRFDMYHQTTNIHRYLRDLAQRHPQMVSTRTIGNSAERRPLMMIKISAEQPTGKAMWIDGGK